MKELLRTNDAVLVSYVRALLNEMGIDYQVADSNMSVVEGSLGILPQRILVAPDDWSEARRILVDAGVGHVVRDQE